MEEEATDGRSLKEVVTRGWEEAATAGWRRWRREARGGSGDNMMKLVEAAVGGD